MYHQNIIQHVIYADHSRFKVKPLIFVATLEYASCEIGVSYYCGSPLKRWIGLGIFGSQCVFFLCYGVIRMHLISSPDRLETLI